MREFDRYIRYGTNFALLTLVGLASLASARPDFLFLAISGAVVVTIVTAFFCYYWVPNKFSAEGNAKQSRENDETNEGAGSSAGLGELSVLPNWKISGASHAYENLLRSMIETRRQIAAAEKAWKHLSSMAHAADVGRWSMPFDRSIHLVVTPEWDHSQFKHVYLYPGHDSSNDRDGKKEGPPANIEQFLS